MSGQTDSNRSGSPHAAVVYFAKAPVAGQVKTRLCPPLTPAEAAALYGEFVRQSVVPIPGVRTLLYGWPESELSVLRGIVPASVEVRPQRGDDLFERMTVCMRDLFAEGASPVLIRNTDSPDLPRARVDQALARCVPGTVVFGPDTGGGYYLVALAEPCPELFDGESGSLRDTVERARALGLQVELLSEERDVDTFDDLIALWRARLTDSRA